MGEATALRERVELVVAGEGESSSVATVVVGFRGDGRWSVYFGGDAAFHFNAGGRLRRAFFENDLYRSQGTTLARLTRVRTADETALRRHDLSDDELTAFLARVRSRLEDLLAAMQGNRARVVRVIPQNAELCPRVTAAIGAALVPQLRLSPAIKGRSAS